MIETKWKPEILLQKKSINGITLNNTFDADSIWQNEGAVYNDKTSEVSRKKSGSIKTENFK